MPFAFSLQEANGVDGKGDEGPPATKLGQSRGSGGVGATGCGSAVGQDSVDDERIGAVDAGDGDKTLVESIVAAVADQAVVVGRIVVVVASADGELPAVALNR